MRVLWLVALALGSTVVVAQSSVQVSGFAALPQGAFADALDEAGGGLDAGFLIAIPGSPVAIGLEGSFVVYGLESREVPLSLTIPDVRVGVTTTNNLAQGLGVVRLLLPREGVRPYVDGVAGVAYLYTETSVVSPPYGTGPALSSTNYEDVAPTAGGGLGALIPLRTYAPDNGGSVLALDLRVRYLVGGEASYLARGGINRFDDGTIRLAPHRSRTDLLDVHVGLSLQF